MKDRKRILFVYTAFSSFVQQDYAILSEHNRVDRFQFQGTKRPARFIYQFVRQLFLLCLRGWRYDAFFIWFADYHSFLPVLFAKVTGKKSFLVAGGYDATAVEALDYGLFMKRNVRSFMGRKSFENCTRILPVDQSLIRNINTYAAARPFEAGIAHFCKVSDDKFNTIATGYDSDKWKADESVTRDSSVVAVASIFGMNTWKLKGGDLLMDVARLLPQYHFYFYGVNENVGSKLTEQASIPKNFHIRGYVDNSQLPGIYSQHKVFAQLSMSEGLPNALCEAMLCGCVPIGSNVNGIPEVIGETGHVLTERNAREASIRIAQLLNAGGNSKPRERIIRNYSLHQRKRKLRQLIDG
tara:strand:- start:1628 stop:2689 length:1062 start_codon:yes stop_codon:yes gene_type:complete